MSTVPTAQQSSDRPANPPSAPPRPRVNLGMRDRLIAGVSGGLFALRPLRRLSFRNLLVGAAGVQFIRWAATGRCPLYRALGINTARHGGAQPEDYFKDSIHVEVAYTVEKPASELYRFWRDFENLPRFMNHLKSVTRQDDRISHWVAKAPAGTSVEWDAEIINDEPDRLIAWRSLQNADVDNAGSIRFIPRPNTRATDVRVVIDYIPPAGRVGSAIARLFGEEPRQQIREDLYRFKQIAETGQLPAEQAKSK